MLSSIFSTSAPVDPLAPNFHPVSSKFAGSELFGELEPKDTEWLCAHGFVAETQTFYHILDDGTFIMCQVIHSSIGLWYPTVQFTCNIYDPKSKERTWKSVSVSNFVCPPPNLDKRSCKGDQFSLTHKSHPEADKPESYTIRANLSENLQISLEVFRPASAPGFKVGKGPKGGYSYFGADTEKSDGFVIHRFWPHTTASGLLMRDGQAIAVNGTGMFVHAIQGMRPNLVASRWNFGFFQSPQHGGVSAIQMEFTTLETYGRKGAGSGGVVVNVGSVVLGGKLAAITAETKWPDETQAEDAALVSRAAHLKPLHDSDTGYEQPSGIVFRWSGPSIVQAAQGTVTASVETDLGSPSAPIGLVEKVDFLAEIPKVIKSVVSYVSGVKPYIYQWLNPAVLKVTAPESFLDGQSGEVKIDGVLYNEATFIS